MSKFKRKIKYLEEGEDYRVQMQISKDCKGFSIDVIAKEAMTHEEIVLVIEEWFQSNILENVPLRTEGPMQ